MDIHCREERLNVIVPGIGMTASVTGMVEDGVIKMGGTDIGRVKSLLATSADWGIGERDLVIAFFKLENGFSKTWLVGIHIVRRQDGSSEEDA